jgi:hypothetical protein
MVETTVKAPLDQAKVPATPVRRACYGLLMRSARTTTRLRATAREIPSLLFGSSSATAVTEVAADAAREAARQTAAGVPDADRIAFARAYCEVAVRELWRIRYFPFRNDLRPAPGVRRRAGETLLARAAVALGSSAAPLHRRTQRI